MTLPLEPMHSFSYVGTHINVYHANKGQGLPRHQHVHNHATICHNGSCVIRKEGTEKICDKNTGAIDMVGTEWHEIEALEDGTVFANIFSEKYNY